MAARTPLRDARVLVVGAGGLGHPAALALAAAGVGSIGVADGDVVEPSNLPRQILFRTTDVGTNKAETLARRLRQRFAARIVPYPFHLDAESAPGIIAAHDFVVDATDGVAAKFLVHDTAVRAGRPLVHAGVVGDRAQILAVRPYESCCLRCLFPVEPAADEVATCQQAGILGPLVGLVGTLQAAAALACLRAPETMAVDRLLIHDNGRWRNVDVARQPDCPLCGADYVPEFGPLDTVEGRRSGGDELAGPPLPAFSRGEGRGEGS